VHQLDNKVFDIIDAQCNHEVWLKTSSWKCLDLTRMQYGEYCYLCPIA